MAGDHMPDELFEAVAHYLPPEQPVGPKGGRARAGHRVVIPVIWSKSQACSRLPSTFIAAVMGSE